MIERANQTSYGLAAGILTKNIDTALTFARAVEAGSVWINCYDATSVQTPVSMMQMNAFCNERKNSRPKTLMYFLVLELQFGGYKQSGYGRGKYERNETFARISMHLMHFKILIRVFRYRVGRRWS